MTVQELAARMTRQVAEGLERVIRIMPPDKQTWRPLEEGRSALHQAQECVVINRWAAQIIREGAVPPVDREAFGAAMAGYDTVEKALAGLKAETEALAAAIEAVPEERLENAIPFPWSGEPSTLAEAMYIAYWNMAYHVGQINYIQTLYGDKEMH